MVQEATLISTIALSLALAFIGGFIAVKLRLSPIVGYLLVGMLLGPHTPGVVADTHLAAELSEIGVILLMFGVGLHFSLKDLAEVRHLAVPGAILQITVATILGMITAWLWGWDFGSGIMLGLALSVASTVVLLRALEERGTLASLNGNIAIGWLIVEDLVMVLTLVLLPALSPMLGGKLSGAPTETDGGDQILLLLGTTVGKVAVFILLMLLVGRRLFPWLLTQVARTGSRELFTLSVIGTALGVAFGSATLFGVSFALGAFFAGIVVRESDLSQRAASEALPLQDAFAVLFFVSVGMLFDPQIILKQPFQVLAVVAIILIGKSIAAFALILLLRYPLSTALTVSASLAQIGEFSFILAGLGVSLGLLSKTGHSLILAGALLSISLNPLMFEIANRLEALLKDRPYFVRLREKEDPLVQLPPSLNTHPPKDHVIIVGYGRVGRMVGQVLSEQEVPFVVVELNRATVTTLRQEGLPIIYGNAGAPGTLARAHLDTAKVLIVTAIDTFQVRQIVTSAEECNPNIKIVIRTHSESERAYLLGKKNTRLVVLGEHELGLTMSHIVLQLYSSTDEEGKWNGIENLWCRAPKPS